ncbi:hypothetical protein Tco_0527266 [Tanacetum coccineum]
MMTITQLMKMIRRDGDHSNGTWFVSIERANRALRSQDRGKRESYRKDSKVEEPAPKALMAIDGIGWD